MVIQGSLFESTLVNRYLMIIPPDNDTEKLLKQHKMDFLLRFGEARFVRHPKPPIEYVRL